MLDISEDLMKLKTILEYIFANILKEKNCKPLEIEIMELVQKRKNTLEFLYLNIRRRLSLVHNSLSINSYELRIIEKILYPDGFICDRISTFKGNPLVFQDFSGFDYFGFTNALKIKYSVVPRDIIRKIKENYSYQKFLISSL